MTLENEEQIDQPLTSLPLYETKDVENFEINEEGIACDDEANFHGIEKGINYT